MGVQSTPLADELFTVGGDVIRSDAKGYMVH